MLFLPILTLAAAIHRCLRLYAPSNVLVARLRAAPQRWRTAGALITLALFFLGSAHGVNVAIAAGAPAWLNLAALILAWDAIKLSWLALGVAARSACRSIAPNPCTPVWHSGERSARRGSAATMTAGDSS